MEVHWDEDAKLEDVGTKRMEGSSLQVEVMQKGPKVSGT